MVKKKKFSMKVSVVKTVMIIRLERNQCCMVFQELKSLGKLSVARLSRN